MIQSKSDYQEYLSQDRLALGISNQGIKNKIKNIFFPDAVWKFQILLRKVEYQKNCKRHNLGKIKYAYLKYRFRKESIRLGFSIPENVFGPGLAIVHYGTIVVNSKAKIGKNCRIHACVNIGASGGYPEAPQLGDNIYIGPGTVIYGDIRIANNVAISAHSTVYRSIEDSDVVVAGSPAKVIKSFEIEKLIKHAV